MQPRRILLLRSGRHLRVALDALGARFPGCRIAVVGTPGSKPAIEQAGIAGADAFVYTGSRFEPLAFFFSRTARAVRRWRYDEVAILWNDPDGQGQGNVDRTAFAMRVRGHLAVTPDGTVIQRALVTQVRAECVRAAASVGVAAVLGLLCYVPALVFGPLVSAVRRMKGPAEAGHYVESGFSRTSGTVESGFSRTMGSVEAGFSRTKGNH